MDIERNELSVGRFSLENLSETDRCLLYEIIEDVVSEMLAAAGVTGD